MKTINTLIIPADNSGSSTYRITFPYIALKYIRKELRFIESNLILPYKELYQNIQNIVIHRQVSDIQTKFILEFIKPLSNHYGIKLIYHADDVYLYDDIPDYNAGKSAFNFPTLKKNMKNIMDACTIIIVTTDELKNYYVEQLGIDPIKFQVIPNYLPRWWFNTYQGSSTMVNKFKQTKKPKIVFPMSTSHFDINNQNNGVDDFSHINDFIRSTCNKYEYSFMGGFPIPLTDLIQSKKIKLIPPSDILNYPRELMERTNPNLIIAPLQDNIFNRCKSSIKLEESWASGVPCIAQDLEPYNKMTDMVFKDANQLQNQIDKLFSNPQKYEKIIKNNRHTCDYGKPNLKNIGFDKGFWLEKNLSSIYNIYTAEQQTITIDLDKLNQFDDIDIKL